nr:MAG TPA: hypothetical protein [Caudoviricetes sp.]
MTLLLWPGQRQQDVIVIGNPSLRRNSFNLSAKPGASFKTPQWRHASSLSVKRILPLSVIIKNLIN